MESMQSLSEVQVMLVRPISLRGATVQSIVGAVCARGCRGVVVEERKDLVVVVA